MTVTAVVDGLVVGFLVVGFTVVGLFVDAALAVCVLTLVVVVVVDAAFVVDDTALVVVFGFCVWVVVDDVCFGRCGGLRCSEFELKLGGLSRKGPSKFWFGNWLKP